MHYTAPSRSPHNALHSPSYRTTVTRAPRLVAQRCRASNIAIAYVASVIAREADVKEEKDAIRQVIFNNKEFKQ